MDESVYARRECADQSVAGKVDFRNPAGVVRFDAEPLREGRGGVTPICTGLPLRPAGGIEKSDQRLSTGWQTGAAKVLDPYAQEVCRHTTGELVA